MAQVKSHMFNNEVSVFVLPALGSQIKSLLDMTEKQFQSIKQKLIKKNNIPKSHSELLIWSYIENHRTDENKKYRKIVQIFVKEEDVTKLVNDTLDDAMYGGTEIVFPLREPSMLFVAAMSVDKSNPLAYVYTDNFFMPLFRDVLMSSGVISETHHAFTKLVKVQDKVVSLLTTFPQSPDVLRCVRRILGQLVDPSNLWFGKKGYLLTLLSQQNDDGNTSYYLVARKPSKGGYLHNSSHYKYVSITATVMEEAVPSEDDVAVESVVVTTVVA